MRYEAVCLLCCCDRITSCYVSATLLTWVVCELTLVLLVLCILLIIRPGTSVSSVSWSFRKRSTMISHAVLCLLATPGRAVRSQTFVSGSTGLRIWPARRTSSWPVSMAEEADTKGTRSCTRSINDSAPTKWRTRSPSPGNT